MSNLDGVIESLKGIVNSGGTIGQMATLLNKEFGLTLDPGDAMINSKDSQVVMAAPIAQDLWYLFNHVNGMTWIQKDANTTDYFTQRLAFFATKLQGIEALKGLTTPTDITKGIPPDTADWDKYMGAGSLTEWKNIAKPWYQLMAFEILFKKQSFRYNSEATTPDDVVGYISFPVAQLGVMEVISLVQQSLTDASTFTMNDDEKPVKESPSLFPPMTGWILNKCYGRHLIESGYLVPDAEKSKYLHPAKTIIPEQKYGADIKPKGWARLWITRTDKWPVPGEFIGILCKPTPVPHCWWFQASYPFLYAGDWFDTWDLTSGIIETKTTGVTHHTNGTSCTLYRVRIYGRLIDIYSSDFLDYTVGDRVGVCKVFFMVKDPRTTSFDFQDQAAQTGIAPEPLMSVDYVIIPITFFQEVT
jgi:hypothetical protein